VVHDSLQIYQERTGFGIDAVVFELDDKVWKYMELPSGEKIAIFPYEKKVTVKGQAEGQKAEFESKITKYCAVVYEPLSDDAKENNSRFQEWTDKCGSLEATVLLNTEQTDHLEDKPINFNEPIRRANETYTGTGASIGFSFGLASAYVSMISNSSLITFVGISLCALGAPIGITIGETLWRKYGKKNKGTTIHAEKALLHEKEYSNIKPSLSNWWRRRKLKKEFEFNAAMAIRDLPEYVNKEGITVTIKKNSLSEIEEHLEALITPKTGYRQKTVRIEDGCEEAVLEQASEEADFSHHFSCINN
jgi:hypothetical protein